MLRPIWFVLSTLALGLSAAAAPITVHFSGEIEELGGASQVPLLPGIEIGTPFSGSYTIDPDDLSFTAFGMNRPTSGEFKVHTFYPQGVLDVTIGGNRVVLDAPLTGGQRPGSVKLGRWPRIPTSSPHCGSTPSARGSLGTPRGAGSWPRANAGLPLRSMPLWRPWIGFQTTRWTMLCTI